MTASSSQLFLYHCVVPPTNLHRALKDLADQLIFQYAFLEWWNAQAECLEAAAALQQILTRNPVDLLSGSLFGEQAEARFRYIPYPPRQQADSPEFWLALVSESNLAIKNGWQEKTVDWDGNSEISTLLLWGSKYHSNGRWTELQIPRWLNYPVVPKAHDKNEEGVLLDVKEYRNAAGAVIVARRFGLRAVIAEKKEVSNEQ